MRKSREANIYWLFFQSKYEEKPREGEVFLLSWNSPKYDLAWSYFSWAENL